MRDQPSTGSPSSRPRLEDLENVNLDDPDVDISTLVRVAKMAIESARTAATAAKEAANSAQEAAKAILQLKAPKEGEEDGEKTPQMVPFLRLFHYSTPGEKAQLWISVIHGAANGVLLPMMALAIGKVLDDFSSGNFNDVIYLFIYLAVASFYTGFISYWLSERCAELQVERLKDLFFNSVVRQEMGYFDTNDPNALNSKVAEDITLYRDGVGNQIAMLFASLAMMISGFAVGFYYSWDIALVTLSGIPILMMCGVILGVTFQNMASSNAEAYSEAGAIAEESITNMRTIQAFGSENYFISRYTSKLQRAQKVAETSITKIGLCIGVFHLSMFGICALSFWYGTKRVKEHLEADCTENCITGGTALTCFFAILISSMSVSRAIGPIEQISKARQALFNLEEIITRESKIDPLDDETGLKPQEVLGTFEFKDVNFAFPSRPTKPIYDRINLTIPAGKTTALVGSSGCGKSCAASLVMRFYDPVEGQILLDGRDLRDLNVKWLRNQISIVSQEPRLFALSIMENIRYGSPNASDEDCIQAAKDANAHSFIMQFPSGYDTYVGGGGSQLSGGQKQRIAIARAMVSNPSILILDEATSALDNESEKVVQDALDRLLLSRKRTTLVIAHRLTTIRSADQICVLQNFGEGSVVSQTGTHDELMTDKSGFYYKLVSGRPTGDELTQPVSPTRRSSFLERRDSNVSSIMRMSSVASTEMMQNLVPHATSFMSANQAIAQSAIDREMFDAFQKKVEQDADEANRLEADKEKAAKEQKKKEFNEKVSQVRSQLYGYIWSHLPWLIFGLFWTCGTGVVMPTFGLLLAELMGVYYEPVDEMMDSSFRWSMILIGIGGCAFVCAAGSFWGIGRVEAYLTRRVREEYFSSLIWQEIGFFDLPENSPGILVSNLSTNAQLVRSLVSDSLKQAIQAAAAIIFALVIGFMYSWQLTLAMIGCFFIVAPGGWLQAKFTIHARSDMNTTDHDENSPGHILTETISSIRVVQSLGIEDLQQSRYVLRLREAREKAMTPTLIAGLGYGYSSAANMIANAFAFWIGSLLINDSFTVVDMFRVVQVMMFAAMGVGQAASFAADQKKGTKAAVELLEIVNRPPLVDARKTDGLDISLLDKDIRFENVKFFYPSRPNVRVFNGVDFTLHAGKTTALVGASGCGKSTTVQLLERFYEIYPGHASPDDPSITHAGRIVVDGQDITKSIVSKWRGQIGLVSQEPVLFQGTIEENISLGAPPGKLVTHEEIVQAAKSANAHDFIMSFKDGYDTQVGFLGSQLSGGQKQRIAIARAIIRDPALLILDEATSALDNESERVVQEALDRLMAAKKRTTLIIAHRLSTIKKADRICCWRNDGTGSKVVEKGTHKELKRIPNGIYRTLLEISEGQ